MSSEDPDSATEEEDLRRRSTRRGRFTQETQFLMLFAYHQGGTSTAGEVALDKNSKL